MNKFIIGILIIFLFCIFGGVAYYFYSRNKSSKPENDKSQSQEEDNKEDDKSQEENNEQDNYFIENNYFEEEENYFEEQDYNPTLNNPYSSDEGISQSQPPESQANINTWQNVPGIGAPMRIDPETGNVQCLSYDGRQCENNSNLSEIRHDDVIPLTCGEDHEREWGGTGYDTPGHWCNTVHNYIAPDTAPQPPEPPSEPEEVPSLLLNVSEQQCADEGGINYNKCPETGITYCCNVCNGRASCPSNGALKDCACIGELTRENSDLVGYSLMYSDMFRHHKFNEEGLWNHWVNHGKNEGRILNPKLPMDDLYNQDGFPAKPMPTIPGWGLLKNDDGNVIFTDGWIWHLPMPTSTQIGDMNNLNMTQVPVDICKFYRDYNNEYGIDRPVKLYVNVDDTAWVIHNNKFIVKVNGFNDNPGIDLTLTPGKNRIMIICYNGGGPAGLQAAMLDDVNDAPLISTSVQSSWRYINDMFNCIEDITPAITIEGFPGDWRRVPGDDIDWDGRLQFFYDFNNTTGTILESKIFSNFDDFGVIFVERQIIGAKGLGDDTPFYAKFRPGKNRITVCIMNYGGPGGLTLRALSMDEQNEYFSTNGNHPWCYKKVNSFYPGPISTVTVYEHSWTVGKNFWYGDWNYERMTNRGHPNDSMTSLRTPESAIFTGFGHGNGSTQGNDGGNLMVSNSTDRHIGDDDSRSIRPYNDAISSFVVQTPIMNGVIMFEHALGGNMYGRLNEGSTKRSLRYWDGYTMGTGGLGVQAGIANDGVSSVYIPHGYTLEMWEHEFGGQYWLHENKTHKYGLITNLGNFNDKISSFKVTKNDSHTYFHVFNENLLKDTRQKFLEQ